MLWHRPGAKKNGWTSRLWAVTVTFLVGGWVFLGPVLFYLPPAAAATRPLIVQLRDRADVSGVTVTLGEIATITGGDPAQRSHLARVYIGRSPLPGSSREISPGYIEVRLRQAGISQRSVRLIPPPGGAVKITTSTQLITAGMLAAAVEEKMARSSVDMTDTAVQVVSAPVIPVPRGDIELQVGNLPSSVSGSFRVRVSVYVDGELCRTIWARVQVVVRHPVVVAAADIAPGTVIVSSAVALQAGSGVAGTVFSRVEDVIGLKARRHIRKGEALVRADVMSPATVERGDTVMIRVRLGDILVRSVGIALESGRPGQVIRVQNRDSQKEIEALVVDKGLVEVKLGK